MVHALLICALALFALWAIGLGGLMASQTTWLLFVFACALVLAWALVAMASGSFGGSGGRRSV